MPQWSRWVFAVWVLLSGTILWLTPYEQLDDLMNIMAIPFIAIGISCQVYRFRRVSEPVQRQQIKWVIIGIVPAGIWSLIHLVLLPAAFPEINTGGWPRVLYNVGSATIWYITIVAVPICFLIAALRYRLWDVDIVVNRSMVYGALTAILAVVYFGIIILLQVLLEAVTGGERSDLVVVASTLVIAALFQPIRQQVQKMIDRRFPNPLARYRPPDAAQIVHDPLTGKHFGTYEVLEPLGSGGMAEIYRGRRSLLNREVAIKVLRAGFGIDPQFRIRFEREAQTVAALRHPNIVQVFDFGVQDGQHYMVMEMIRGHDLARYLRENGRLQLREALPIIQDVAAALDYAHDQGLIHCDVKPSNVMLQPVTGSQIKIQSPLQAYRAILTDFGVAKILSDGSDLTKTGVVGTLDYLAPEQIIAPKDIDRRVDVYAFGAMVYGCCAVSHRSKMKIMGWCCMRIYSSSPLTRERLPRSCQKRWHRLC